MKLVVSSIRVGEEDGFKNDILDRKFFGEALLNLVKQTSDELVISIDGRWGEGKTTFIKMWQGLLKKNNIPSIYIDAFENDYTGDAFMSIAGAITTYVDSHAIDTAKKEEFKDKAKRVGVQLLSWTVRVGVKAATLGIIKDSDIEAVNVIKESLANDGADEISKLVKDRLSAQSIEKNLIQSFKESLSEIPLALNESSENRIVIIIDELDRCKPSFAVEIIEKIKHLFSVENVIFVLGMNKTQLEEAIKCVYGNNIDAHSYLQKFINIETTLPKRNDLNNYSNDIRSYSRHLLELHEFNAFGDEEGLVEVLVPLGRHFNLSLRQLEKVFTNLAIIYSTSHENSFRVFPVFVLLSILKVVDPTVFSAIANNNFSFNQLSKKVGLSNLKEDDNREIFHVMNWMKYIMMTDDEFNELDPNDPVLRYGNGLFRYNIDRRNILAFFCSKMTLFKVN